MSLSSERKILVEGILIGMDLQEKPLIAIRYGADEGYIHISQMVKLTAI